MVKLVIVSAVFTIDRNTYDMYKTYVSLINLPKQIFTRSSVVFLDSFVMRLYKWRQSYWLVVAVLKILSLIK